MCGIICQISTYTKDLTRYLAWLLFKCTSYQASYKNVARIYQRKLFQRMSLTWHDCSIKNSFLVQSSNGALQTWLHIPIVAWTRGLPSLTAAAKPPQRRRPNDAASCVPAPTQIQQNTCCLRDPPMRAWQILSCICALWAGVGWQMHLYAVNRLSPSNEGSCSRWCPTRSHLLLLISWMKSTPSVSFYLSLDSAILHYPVTNKKCTIQRQIKRNRGSIYYTIPIMVGELKNHSTKGWQARRRTYSEDSWCKS
jgi:hypothetical protein